MYFHGMLNQLCRWVWQALNLVAFMDGLQTVKFVKIFSPQMCIKLLCKIIFATTMYLGSPLLAAIRAYTEMGLRLPIADTGRGTITSQLWEK